jgi:hypothetical protein
MSLTFIKKSPIFYSPEKTCYGLKIDEILYSNKVKFKIINRTSSTPKQTRIEKLSLSQNRGLEHLHKTTPVSQKLTLNSLINGFNNNDWDSSYEEDNAINAEAFKLFRAGKNYRSPERAKGAGVNNISANNLKDYFQSTEIERCGD